jgi:predicted ATPase
MLKSLHLKNFTVFPDAKFAFGKNLNIIVGENGSGKSHVLKAAYCAITVGVQPKSSAAPESPTKSALSKALAEKLQNVFRPDSLGRLVRRSQGRNACEIQVAFGQSHLDVSFRFSTLSKTDVVVVKAPTVWADKQPVFMPTRELLTIYPGFVSLYETSHTEFEESWRDTCLLLGGLLARGPREKAINVILTPLEQAMGGSVVLDKAGRFYLRVASGTMEMHLVAEGLRKLATIARLVATGALIDKGYLFWDEPEANLNPKIIKAVAATILQLAQSGIQIFIATHSLFLLRELHILQKEKYSGIDTRCFGLRIDEPGGVRVQQGESMDDIGDIATLDEDLMQSERYIDTETGVPTFPPAKAKEA